MVQWGTQEQLTPPTRAAQRAKASSRIQEMSNPKTFYYPFGYVETKVSERRASVETFHRPNPVWPVRSEAMHAKLTSYTAQLAKPKNRLAKSADAADRNNQNNNNANANGRPQLLRVHSCSMARIGQLATPKQPPNDYKPPRPPQTQVSIESLKASLSPRGEDLSAPRPKQAGPFRDPMWQIPTPAKSATPTLRLTELSKHKVIPDEYKQPYSPAREISAAAKRAVASTRVSELSSPAIRDAMDKVQFNAQAFVVSEAALKARASNRITELAQPIVR
ncbi:hypothetical protein NP493_850g01013 [Ridgeia piscesae]|uniref:Testicular haploid expressed gene protein-like n=1 Tax=Ridgeia piscesae TaxID=27915 RepID=A0AAD9NMA0_RIDPI|nr:hypothetical protein NP493_850g01013 [Ridgeia piscesae]